MKKILTVILAVSLLTVLLPTNTYAGSASNTVGNYRLIADCYQSSSSHKITALAGASFPTGSATVSYSLNGTPHVDVKIEKSTSYQSYWLASFSNSRAIMMDAVTKGYGRKARAIYP